MTRKTRILIVLYTSIALLALVFSWYHAVAYLGDGFAQANMAFWQDALLNANPAGKFLTVDILYLALACNLWMYVEGRRIGVKYITGYVLAGAVIAISFAFPLFLAMREIKLSETTALPQASLKYHDILVLLLLAAVTLSAGVIVM
ncbi:DUF2834 domain-containing protein [Litorivivens sp.]|uniref:DUF2834 domain-containing protein n=1 Tax=Litorivivens sp. TaxID=2020868 RepID=UPI003564E208